MTFETTPAVALQFHYRRSLEFVSCVGSAPTETKILGTALRFVSKLFNRLQEQLLDLESLRKEQFQYEAYDQDSPGCCVRVPSFAGLHTSTFAIDYSKNR